MTSSTLQNKTSKNIVPNFGFADICVGALSGAKGDLLYNNNRENKRGTCHIKVKSYLA